MAALAKPSDIINIVTVIIIKESNEAAFSSIHFNSPGRFLPVRKAALVKQQSVRMPRKQIEINDIIT